MLILLHIQEFWKKNTFEKTWLNLRNPTMEDQNISEIQLHCYNHASCWSKEVGRCRGGTNTVCAASETVQDMLVAYSQPWTKCVCAEGQYLEHNAEDTFYKHILYYKLRPKFRNVLTLPHMMLSHYLLCICPICELFHSGFSFLLCHQKFLRISSHSLGWWHVVFFNHHTLPFLSLITHHLANNIKYYTKGRRYGITLLFYNHSFTAPALLVPLLISQVALK